MTRRWCADERPYAGGKTLTYVVTRLPGGPNIRLHCFITGWARVDHRNGDGLDCRDCNLREVTHAQNMHNGRPRRDGLSRYKGVSRRDRRWYARIRRGGGQRGLGTFDSEVVAALAYDAAAAEQFGEFAWLNRDHFPEIRSAHADP
jgi:hypothetical protein